MMRSNVVAAMAALFAISFLGCSHLPGKPGFRPETMRPDQVHDFATLYQQNCSACHGDNGLHGAALPLNNPVYLAWAGHDRIANIVANGVSHTLMPAFGQGGGGMLTGQQVEDIASGMISHWGKPDAMDGSSAPGYAAPGGDVAQGQAAFQAYCGRCHGSDGAGMEPGQKSLTNPSSATGSIVDPTYLSLISAQGLRSIIVSGIPGEDMPNWRGDAPEKAMTDSDVTNIVAWLESHKSQSPNQGPASLPEQQKQKQQNLGVSGKNRRRLQE